MNLPGQQANPLLGVRTVLRCLALQELQSRRGGAFGMHIPLDNFIVSSMQTGNRIPCHFAARLRLKDRSDLTSTCQKARQPISSLKRPETPRLISQEEVRHRCSMES